MTQICRSVRATTRVRTYEGKDKPCPYDDTDDEKEALMRTFLRWLIVLALPAVLIVGAVRALTWPWFPAWEYSRAGFPPDTYGMPAEERLWLARECVTFLNLPADLERLGRLQLEDGSAAFNSRELEHMADVKRVYDQLTSGALLALVMMIAAGWSLRQRGAGAAAWGALSDGGLLTLLALLGVGGLMLTSWDTFFVGLHGLFFTEGTWRFFYSDTLIRLFPVRFWQDAGLWVAGTVAVTAFILALAGRVVQRRLTGVELPNVPVS